MAGNEQFARGNIWGSLKGLFNLNCGWYVFSGAPVSGSSGTYANKAGIGARLLDSATGTWYVNLGTLAVPQWMPMGGPVALGTGGASGGGLGAVGNAKMTYSFAVDGGAIATITPSNSPTLPAGAIILGGVLDVTTSLTSGGAAQVSIGTSAGSSVTALKASAVLGTEYAAGLRALTPVFTAATYVKLTAAGRLTLTVTVATLTAGRFDVNVAYVQGN